ncbi:thioredoxin family protein [Actinotalea sp. Marseille-Q4924]|uniref:TlpA family protein disulfide reductase n=1 Tax=Actinotalea sp. Marseille-Q4924 TaxID=2866571 RepID=UPI001CE41F94|nr:thioredoxin family protein [Actinotalea sp. Marseille-Q4924]
MTAFLVQPEHALGTVLTAAADGGAAGSLGSQGLVLLAVLAAATVTGLLLRRSDGRFRAAEPGVRVGADELGHALGSHRTFLQLSAATCATCPQVARALGAVAGDRDGVAHVEIRVEEHDALVRRLGVLRTPTVLLLDADGIVLSRTSGPMRPDQARAALDHDDLVAVAR